jgi:putative transposase
MNNYKNMTHRRWDSNYHLVLVPKKRMKVVFIGGSLRRYLGNFIHEPARQKSIVIVEGNLLNDPMSGCSNISQKNIKPRVVGYLKGKGTMEISKDFERSRRKLYEKNISGKKPYTPSTESDDELAAKDYSPELVSEEAYFAQSSWI